MQNLAFLPHSDSSQEFIYQDTQDILRRTIARNPLFVFCESDLYDQSEKLQQFFPGEVSYAVKANPDKKILNTLWNSGICSFDVASIGEIKLLRTLFPKCQLHYNNPIKSQAMISEAFTLYDVRSFVIDDQFGLDMFKSIDHSDLEITVRFKLPHENAAYDFGSKFGATIEQSIDLLKKVGEMDATPSLTFHPGSQCTDPDMYIKYIQAAANIARSAGLKLHKLNVGGGFPVSYNNSNIDTVETFFEHITKAVSDNFKNQLPQLLCEPGRAMVASSCALLTQVIHVRENGDVFINDGVYGGLQEQLIMDCELPARVWRNGELVNQHILESRSVFGPTCDPLDKLTSQSLLPASIQPGDYIEFGLMGAYGSATATMFNGFDIPDYVNVYTGFKGEIHG